MCLHGNCIGQREQELKQLEIDSAQVLFDKCLKLKVKNQHLQDTMGKKIQVFKGIMKGVQEFQDRQVFIHFDSSYNFISQNWELLLSNFSVGIVSKKTL